MSLRIENLCIYTQIPPHIMLHFEYILAFVWLFVCFSKTNNMNVSQDIIEVIENRGRLLVVTSVLTAKKWQLWNVHIYNWHLFLLITTCLELVTSPDLNCFLRLMELFWCWWYLHLANFQFDAITRERI